MEKRAEVLAWIAACAGLGLGSTALLLGKWANAAVMVPAALAGFVVMLTGLMAAGYVRFQRRRLEEEADLHAYRQDHGVTDLFADADEGVRVAARACVTYLKWFTPAFTVVLALLLLVSALLLWKHWSGLGSGQVGSGMPTADSLPWAVLALSLFVFNLVAGSYYSGISRERGGRWLRPCAAWLFFCGFLFLLGGLTLIGEHFQVAIAQLDVRMARFGVGLVMVLGGETLLNFVIEFYRPRMPSEEVRPLYESRLLALVTEPGGMARNVAATLDYQFGFKVSEAWFYRFMEKGVLPFIMVMALCFWLMSCFIVVEADQQGLRETFGRVAEQQPMGPGLYVKLPWPMGKIITYDVERVQQVDVGYQAGDAVPEADDSEQEGDLTGRVIVWSKQHNKAEVDFVVASKPEYFDPDLVRDDGGALPVPVYFLAASVPVYYRVNNLYKFHYCHNDAQQLLRQIAYREIVRYLATVDFFEILAQRRMESAAELAARIQAAATSTELGVDILFVGLQGVHPPVKVGDAFHSVVEAMTEKHSAILSAERVAIEKGAEAEASSIRTRYAARGYRTDRVQVAAAEAERFHKQLRAYLAAPQLFVMRSYLDVLETDGAKVRKYVVAAAHGTGVFVINLEKKLRPDLLDLNVDQPADY